MGNLDMENFILPFSYGFTFFSLSLSLFRLRFRIFFYFDGDRQNLKPVCGPLTTNLSSAQKTYFSVYCVLKCGKIIQFPKYKSYEDLCFSRPCRSYFRNSLKHFYLWWQGGQHSRHEGNSLRHLRGHLRCQECLRPPFRLQRL